MLEAEIKSCGEAVLEVGAPNGWGPCGLTEDQLALALDRVRAAADRAGGDVTVLRQRAIETPLPAGGSAVSQARCNATSVHLSMMLAVGKPANGATAAQ